LHAGVCNARVLLRDLRDRNYTGGYTLLTDWLRPQRDAASVVAVRRFETLPGKQAQIDWGHLGSITEDGEERQLWGFTITLGYRRRMMAAAATDQKPGTLLRMRHRRTRRDYLERGLSRFRALLGLHAAAVPGIPATDQGQDRIRREVPQAQLPVRVTGS